MLNIQSVMDTGNTQADMEGSSVNIHGIKHRISMKFPDSEITKLLLSMPDEMPAGELIGAVFTLLAVADTEQAKEFRPSLSN